MFLVLHTKRSAVVTPCRYFRTACFDTPRYFMASEGLGAVMKTNNTHALTARSNQLMAHVFYIEPHYELISARRNTASVTETANMDDSNGTNLKPIHPVL